MLENEKLPVFDSLMHFIEDLKRHKIYHRVECHSPLGIMVIVDAPRRKWEVEFQYNGIIEVEEFKAELVEGFEFEKLQSIIDQAK